MIIQRPYETRKIREISKWLLIYGRRKTGKSFLVENFTDYDDYFFVKRDRSVISKKDGSLLSYDTFMEVFGRGIADNKTIVVDEFHRLGDGFFDFLHASFLMVFYPRSTDQRSAFFNNSFASSSDAASVMIYKPRADRVSSAGRTSPTGR